MSLVARSIIIILDMVLRLNVMLRLYSFVMSAVNLSQLLRPPIFSTVLNEELNNHKILMETWFM